MRTPTEATRQPRYLTEKDTLQIGLEHITGIFLDLIKSDSVNYRELKAYCDLQQIYITAWEAKILIEMLNQYYSFTPHARKDDCYNPLWSDDDIEQHEMMLTMNHIRQVSRNIK